MLVGWMADILEILSINHRPCQSTTATLTSLTTPWAIPGVGVDERQMIRHIIGHSAYESYEQPARGNLFVGHIFVLLLTHLG